MIEIPLNSSPEQRFSINLLGETYEIIVYSSFRWKVWSISFYQNNEPVQLGIPLLGGANLVSQYNLPFDELWIVNINNSTLDANLENLGTITKVILLEPTDLEEIQSGETV